MDCSRSDYQLLCFFIYLSLAGVTICFNLTILHTNDVHSRIDEAYKFGGICSDNHRSTNSCVGGVSRIMSKLKEIRSLKPNVLLLDAGDQFQGTFWFSVFQGLASAVFMKELKYDAMTFGNHEFDLGIPALQAFVQNVSSSFEILCANCDNSNEPGLSGYKSYTIREVNGRKVGIVGYTTPDTTFLVMPGGTGGLVFHNEILYVRAAVNELKTKNPEVNIIIALGHSGLAHDLQLAKEVDGVDVVIGGHTHSFLYTGQPPAEEVPVGEYPIVVLKNDNKKALCVQAFFFSKYLGNLEVQFDEKGDIVSYSGLPALLDYRVPKDPSVEFLLTPYREKVTRVGSAIIAVTNVFLNGTCRLEECNMGNLIADAFTYANAFKTGSSWGRASISLINGGGIRSSISQGNITYGDLVSALPFVNTIVAVTVNGTTLKKVFENSVSRYNESSGRFLQVSGVKVTYDVSKPVGSRVIELQALCLECNVPVYQTIRCQANYTVIAPKFLADGGDQYTMLKTERLGYQDLGTVDVDMTIEYITRLAKVYPAVEGRIKFRLPNNRFY